MVSVYSDEDFLAVKRQRNKILYVFWGVTAVYACVCVAFLAYYISLPYASPNTWISKWVVGIVSVLYVLFLFPFMSIKFHRVNRYYKMLYYVSEGLKNEEANYFVCFEQKDLQKDFVDVISCVFKTWSKKKNEWLEREAYFDPEKGLPKFEYGDLVHYIVQSNFIVQYEIIQKGALDNDEREIYLDEEYEDDKGGEIAFDGKEETQNQNEE